MRDETAPHRGDRGNPRTVASRSRCWPVTKDQAKPAPRREVTRKLSFPGSDTGSATHRAPKKFCRIPVYHPPLQSGKLERIGARKKRVAASTDRIAKCSALVTKELRRSSRERACPIPDAIYLRSDKIQSESRLSSGRLNRRKASRYAWQGKVGLTSSFSTARRRTYGRNNILKSSTAG